MNKFTERRKIQEEFRSQLIKILKENPNYKSEDQIISINDIKTLYNGRIKVLNFYKDYESDANLIIGI